LLDLGPFNFYINNIKEKKHIQSIENAKEKENISKNYRIMGIKNRL